MRLSIPLTMVSYWTDCYADDSHLYMSFYPDSSVYQDVAFAKMESCIDYLRNRMVNDKLKLNDKTKIFIIGTSQQLARVSIISFRVGKAVITPVATAGNLGSRFDPKTMASHVTKTCNSAYYYLYYMRRISNYISLKKILRL